ncbi:MAG: hypothetical protein N2515_10510, partial [Deltaproteobacteria bacterium]|nr:hypothetical protein [Deltaproteobacteria bacterium]
MMEDRLVIGGKTLRSRLFVGTGKFANLELCRAAIEASGAEVVTVAVRRVDFQSAEGQALTEFLIKGGYMILPNTAGCYTAEDAVRTARLARELLGTPFIKLEVIGDPKTLFPDVVQTIEAAKILVREGFAVMAYTNDDPVTAKRLEELGCVSVMPLGAPIGSGLGIRNPYNIEIILEQAQVPIVVDAGGIHPVHVGDMPLGISKLLTVQAGVQQMAVDAAVNADKELALQALLIDPVVNTIT